MSVATHASADVPAVPDAVRNPSYARWMWRVTPDADGSRVTVAGALHLVTSWRRLLLVRVRSPARPTEIPASLTAQAAAVTKPVQQPRSRPADA